MNPRDIFHLKKPCKNRGVNFEDIGNGKVKIDGKIYESILEIENYLEKLPRIDTKG